jgi:hypothetical protein
MKVLSAKIVNYTEAVDSGRCCEVQPARTRDTRLPRPQVQIGGTQPTIPPLDRVDITGQGVASVAATQRLARAESRRFSWDHARLHWLQKRTFRRVSSKHRPPAGLADCGITASETEAVESRHSFRIDPTDLYRDAICREL